MFASAVSFFWPLNETQATTQPEEKRRAAPVFIGDAVQPFGQDTLLLAILRRDAEDQPTE
ncbi:hypothetical protein [uncultured Roseobacter sp.]|uniref:hypothetical protein n=1 Tax=uncultured Roseobacter sp. TaxID=114847 RepID=UPI002622D466|nr:hypothetical protein [uncultured Roseobacter sp.]